MMKKKVAKKAVAKKNSTVKATAIKVDDKMRRRAAKLFKNGKTATQVMNSLKITQQGAAAMSGAWQRGSYDHLTK